MTDISDLKIEITKLPQDSNNENKYILTIHYSKSVNAGFIYRFGSIEELTSFLDKKLKEVYII